MEQLERAKRYLIRIRRNEKGFDGAGSPEHFENALDDVFAFFLIAYHVKDWIVQSGEYNVTMAQANRFIAKHRELRACADLCNTTKHLELRQSWTKNTAQISEACTFMNFSGKTATAPEIIHHTAYYFAIKSEGREYLVSKLAEKCIELWGTFLAGCIPRLQPDPFNSVRLGEIQEELARPKKRKLLSKTTR
jgi:hypothetical protein